ncbi:MAG: DUF3465 domain-containing protein [Pseudomonadota bacterium]
MRLRRRKFQHQRAAVALVVVIFLAIGSQVREGFGPSSGGSVDELFAAQRSGVMLTVDGTVERVLSDDNDGSRHQRFIIETPSGLTLLVAHNIDLAPRVAGLRRGDAVRLHGQYEWNDRGGVMHWTHHDPAGRHEEGWIEHEGEVYR